MPVTMVLEVCGIVKGMPPPPLYAVFGEAERGIYITFIEIIETFSKNPLSGLIQRFLSARFWIPLSRLTYSTYLVHPIVLTFIFKSSNTALYYSPKTVVSKILYRSWERFQNCFFPYTVCMNFLEEERFEFDKDIFYTFSFIFVDLLLHNCCGNSVRLCLRSCCRHWVPVWQFGEFSYEFSREKETDKLKSVG